MDMWRFHERQKASEEYKKLENNEDWMKEYMIIRVDGRRPVVRPRKTWLENVEIDMAELETDREVIHDRKKWKHNVVTILEN